MRSGLGSLSHDRASMSNFSLIAIPPPCRLLLTRLQGSITLRYADSARVAQRELRRRAVEDGLAMISERSGSSGEPTSPASDVVLHRHAINARSARDRNEQASVAGGERVTSLRDEGVLQGKRDAPIVSWRSRERRGD